MSGYSGDISTLETDVSRLTTDVDKYAVPQYKEDDAIIVDSDVSTFRNGVMVGRFSNRFFDRTDTDEHATRGILLAYNINPLSGSTSPYFPAWVQILILDNFRVLIRYTSGSWGNFQICSEPQYYSGTITNEFLNGIPRRSGVYKGDIATEITGASEAVRGIVRAYSFTDSVNYADGNDCMQIAETVTGIRKTRWYDYMQNTWSAWV